MAYYYVGPPPYNTTFLNKTFPGTHGPLENARHQVGSAIHYFLHGSDDLATHSPRADVHETIDKFYIDVELPGIGAKDDFKLKWTNSRTLLVEAKVKKLELQVPKSETGEGEVEDKAKHPDHSVHCLVKERRTGTLARAFDFLVEVDHGTMEAKLQNGLLNIVLEKKLEEQEKHKDVEVQHADV